MCNDFILENSGKNKFSKTSFFSSVISLWRNYRIKIGLYFLINEKKNPTEVNIQTVGVVWYFTASTNLGSVGTKNSANYPFNSVVPFSWVTICWLKLLCHDQKPCYITYFSLKRCFL